MTRQWATMSSKYEKIRWRGVWVDRWTKAALLHAEAILGYQLRITQGSFNGTDVWQSGGTHAGAGALDIAVPANISKHEIYRIQKALRQSGFAAWYRPYLAGYWNHHFHAVLIGNDNASQAAKNQVASYRQHRNGLANNARDTTWHPDPIKEFAYGGDDMLTKADLQEIAEVVRDMTLKYTPRVNIDAPKNSTDYSKNPRWSLDNHLETQSWHAMATSDKVRALTQKVLETDAKVDALLKQSGLSEAQLDLIRESARTGAEEAIEGMIDSAEVTLAAARPKESP